MVSHQSALFICDLAHCGLTAAGCSLSLLIKYLVVKYGARNCRCLCLILVHLDTNATDFYFICGGFENQNILQEGK